MTPTELLKGRTVLSPRCDVAATQRTLIMFRVAAGAALTFLLSLPTAAAVQAFPTGFHVEETQIADAPLRLTCSSLCRRQLWVCWRRPVEILARSASTSGSESSHSA